MIIIKNARFADGSLHSLALSGGQFSETHRQKSEEHIAEAHLSLEAYAARSQDPAWIAAQTGPLLVDARGELVVPGGIDVHLHSRDPGFPEKETWGTLGEAAFRGGVVAVVDMPNTEPPTLYREEILDKAARARASGLYFKFLLGVTAENLEGLPALLQDPSLPLCGLKIYYGQSTGNLHFVDLEQLATKVPQLHNSMLVFHAEDQNCIDRHSRALSPTGDYASVTESYAVHSLIRDSDSAVQATTALIRWAKRWKRAIHIAHVSTPDEMALIAAARAEGVHISSEVCPHHLLLSVHDYEQLGGFLKVNPPVRSRVEVDLLRRYMGQGSIDCFVTDHAPHTKAEKLRPYSSCPSGIPAIEFYWPLFAQACALSGASMATLLSMVSSTPARLFGFPRLGHLAPGYLASFVWLSSEEPRTISPDQVKAHCGWSPYIGTRVPVCVKATWQEGTCRYIA
jgi:dihydroorotase